MKKDKIWKSGMKSVSPNVRVRTMYKRKADKILPVNSSVSDGSKPGGVSNWRERAIAREEKSPLQPNRYPQWLRPRQALFAVGARLTPERAERMKIGDELTPQERDVFLEMLYNREGALAWAFNEIGKISEDIAEPQVIRTVPHEAWQAKGFHIPKALMQTVVDIVGDRKKKSLLENCYGPYRNSYFLVKKKDKGYRLINACMQMNKVTIRDANLPPSSDEYSEDFAGMHIVSLIDWFSGYDQVPLAEESRDMTAFQTPIGLLRNTTLPQGATNSVAQFVRVSNKVLEAQIPKKARPFMDDVGVKGPKTDYDQEEVAPGIRRFVLEHIQNLDEVLCDIERAGATISGEKSQWCMSGLKVVGYICDKDGRHPDDEKIEKILDWRACENTSELRGFLGICVYYRIWIEGFSHKVAVFYHLLKKGVAWHWGKEEDDAMEILKEALTSAPALASLDYSEGAGLIILAFDASIRGWGAVLMQLARESKHRHPVRYESGLWNHAESQYDAGKLECRALLKALKKFKQWLYGVTFVVETDAQTLCAQLNRSATDLPGALVTQWLAWIRLFDFEVRHIPGVKNVVADALSRRPATERDRQQAEKEEDIDEWVNAQLSCVRIMVIRVGNQAQAEQASTISEVEFVEGEYSEESCKIAHFLQHGLARPERMSTSEFRKFRQHALNFFVRRGHLFRRASKRNPARRVVDGDERREMILKELHDDSGHRGREATYRRVADRYWWNQLWEDVRRYIKTCYECQLRDSTRMHEEMYPTWVDRRWEVVSVDVVHMPKSRGFHFLVQARSNFSGWLESRAIKSNDSAAVSKFLWEDVICRHGIFRKVIMDGGPENKALTDALLKKYNIRKVVISAHNPQANGLVEVGHRPVSDALSKMCRRPNRSDWVDHLHAVLWADRTTVRSSTGMTPYEVEFADRPILPIELDVCTWSVLPWDEVTSTTDLLAMRARALERREDDLDEARLRLRRMREKGKEQFDARHRTRQAPLEAGMLVLSHDTFGSMNVSSSKKLDFRWFGPFRITKAIPEKGTYILSELNGAVLKGTYAGHRLKQFFPRENWREDAAAAATSADRWRPDRQPGLVVEIPAVVPADGQAQATSTGKVASAATSEEEEESSEEDEEEEEDEDEYEEEEDED